MKSAPTRPRPITVSVRPPLRVTATSLAATAPARLKSGILEGAMTDKERREFQGWARVVSAGWFILWTVAAITIYRVNSRRAVIAMHFAIIALPGIIAAVAIGRRSC